MLRKAALGVLMVIGALLCIAEFACAFVFSSLAFGVIAFCLMAVGINVNPWVRCEIPLPERGFSAVFMQKHAHQFLAEYHYKLSLATPCGSSIAILPFNSGGRTFSEVSFLPMDAKGGPWLKLRGCIVDVSSGRSYVIGDVAGAERKFMLYELSGELDFKGSYKVEIDASEWPLAKGRWLLLGTLNGREHPLRFEPAQKGAAGAPSS